MRPGLAPRLGSAELDPAGLRPHGQTVLAEQGAAWLSTAPGGKVGRGSWPMGVPPRSSPKAPAPRDGRREVGLGAASVLVRLCPAAGSGCWGCVRGAAGGGSAPGCGDFALPRLPPGSSPAPSFPRPHPKVPVETPAALWGPDSTEAPEPHPSPGLSLLVTDRDSAGRHRPPYLGSGLRTGPRGAGGGRLKVNRQHSCCWPTRGGQQGREPRPQGPAALGKWRGLSPPGMRALGPAGSRLCRERGGGTLGWIERGLTRGQAGPSPVGGLPTGPQAGGTAPPTSALLRTVGAHAAVPHLATRCRNGRQGWRHLPGPP